MSISKSNKHELSLDLTKPDEKSGCTLATPYALIDVGIDPFESLSHKLSIKCP